TSVLAARLEQDKDALVQACGQVLLLTGYGVLVFQGHGVGSILIYWAVVQIGLLLIYLGFNMRWSSSIAIGSGVDQPARQLSRRIARYSLFQYLAMVAHFASDPA